jgi:hypothetical protein
MTDDEHAISYQALRRARRLGDGVRERWDRR